MDLAYIVCEHGTCLLKHHRKDLSFAGSRSEETEAFCDVPDKEAARDPLILGRNYFCGAICLNKNRRAGHQADSAMVMLAACLVRI